MRDPTDRKVATLYHVVTRHIRLLADDRSASDGPGFDAAIKRQARLCRQSGVILHLARLGQVLGKFMSLRFLHVQGWGDRASLNSIGAFFLNSGRAYALQTNKLLKLITRQTSSLIDRVRP